MAKFEWLNKEFLEKCLGEEVEEFTTKDAAPPGNNYGSCVTRVTIQLKNEGIGRSLIIKSEITEGPIAELQFTKTFEHYFYYTFLPESKKITPVKFPPKNFPSPRPYTVILEDLNEQGFVMVDRIKLLDFAHCKLYMIAAAEFHAVSFAVNEKNPKVLQQFTMEEVFKALEKGLDMFKMMVMSGIECFIECTEKEEKFKRVHDVVKGVSGRFWEILMDVYKSGSGLKTLTQGDPWITNMMFRYSERGEVCGIKLLDFQSLKIASPVYDLVVFIWSSANNDVRNSRIDDLLRIYMDNFNENLFTYGCKEVLTHEVLMEEFVKLSPQVLFVVCSFLPFVLDPEPIDFASFSVGQAVNPFRKCYSEDFCQVHLPQVIAQMENMGIIDNLEKHLK